MHIRFTSVTGLHVLASGFQLLVVVLATCLTIQAQGGVGSTRGLPETSGGTNSIQGRLFFHEGSPTDKSFKITLESVEDTGRSTHTDPDGAFRFNNLKAGSYTIIVDGGKDYENARETVHFEGSRRNVVVPIYLKSKAAAAALAKVPSAARAAYNKGLEAAGKGDSNKAAEFLAEAVRLYPEFHQALTELGLHYIKLNKWENAADTYRALLKLQKDNAGANLNLGIALYYVSLQLLNEKKMDEANEKLTEAEQFLRQAIALNFGGPNPHYYLGLTLIRFKKYDEAQKEMELAIANGGEKMALAHKYLGGLHMNAKRNKEAATHLEKYLQLDSKAPDAEQIRKTIKSLTGGQ